MEENLLCYIEEVVLIYYYLRLFLSVYMDDYLLGFYSLLYVWLDILENNEYSQVIFDQI